MLAQQNHVVVISGLPSLPEDRPSNPVTVMESHDYSTSRHTYHSITTLGSNEILISDEFSYDDDGTMTAAADRYTDDSTMDTSSGTTHHLPPKTSLKNQQHCQQQQQQQCNESLLHKALAYPPGFHQPPPTNNKSCTTTMPNPLSHPPALGTSSFPIWQGSSSSRGGNNGVLAPCVNTLLLDLTDGGDSVKSECTSTTAESSYHRDHHHWGTTTTHGVKQQRGGAVRNNCSNTTNYCPTSSLATELHGFNIDSDCEASSVATLASIATTSSTAAHRSEEDGGGTSSPLSTADGDTTSTTTTNNTVTSYQSSKSSRSAKSSSTSGGSSSRKKQILLRATAHERILKIRSDQSSKMRADVIHSQRQGVGACIGDDHSTDMTDDDSKMRQQQQQHNTILQAANQDVLSRTPPAIPPGRLAYIDHGSGRTPVASNCSDVLSNLRKLREIEKNYKHLFPYSSLWGGNNNNSSIVDGGSSGGSEGVHIALPSPPCLTTGLTPPNGIYTNTTGIQYNSRFKPLGLHPQLTNASRRGGGGGATTTTTTTTTASNIAPPNSTSIIEQPISSTSSFELQHKNYTTNMLSPGPKNSSSTRNYHHERTPTVVVDMSKKKKNNSSTRNYHHERTPSIDEDLLEVALSLAGMKRSG
jgi:hypothetical protein